MGNQIIGRFSLKERRDGNFVPLDDHDLVRAPNLKGSFEIGTPIARFSTAHFYRQLGLHALPTELNDIWLRLISPVRYLSSMDVEAKTRTLSLECAYFRRRFATDSQTSNT